MQPMYAIWVFLVNYFLVNININSYKKQNEIY